MTKIPSLASTFLALVAFSGASRAQEVRPFPFGPEGDRLAPEASELASLAGLREVILGAVPLSGGAHVDLRLDRVEMAPGVVYVDGEATDRALDADLTLWSGSVVGAEGSQVYLALSPLGSRGWIRRGGDLVHLLAEPGPGGDWTRSRSRFVSEREILAMGMTPKAACSTLPVPKPAAPAGPGAPPPSVAAGSASPLPLYRCDVAVETDWQFTTVFGNVGAAQSYAVSLFGAVSERYREQIGAILAMPYLGLYTSSNDPWHTAESGGGTWEMLNEFMAGWSSGPPVPAHLSHFFSGADLGGGIAWLPALCDPVYGFAVSANLAGNTPFPIVQSPLNWDFMVVAHELGHNFGSPHTHDFCPPLDSCWSGQCTTQTSCVEGTLMSYCHLCPSGLANVDPVFHPACVSLMRAEVEASCLPLYAGIPSQQSLGNAKPGSNGTPSLAVQFVTGPNRVRFTASSAPSQGLGVLIAADSTLFAPFLGGVLVPTPQHAFAFTASVAGSSSLDVPAAFSAASGVTVYAQAWYLDGASFAATNGMEFEVVLP